MKLANWNIRGVNPPHKQRDLRSLISSNNISLFGLNETKVSEENSTSIAAELLWGWQHFFNYQSHQNGRIWVCWNPDIVEVTIVTVTDQMIHTKVKIIQKQITFLASFVYGLHTRREQATLWHSLQEVADSDNTPWVVLGDFNVVRKPEEREGGSLVWTEACEDLERCCMEAQLDDLRFSGHYLTWSRGEGENYLARKLDRVLVNHVWLETFVEAEARFLPPGLSDHSPMIVSMGLPLLKRKSFFKFFDLWTESPLFMDIVEKVWQTQIDGTPIYRFCQKLKLLKSHLRLLNNNNYSNISSRCAVAKEKLLEIQEQLRHNQGCPSLKNQEKTARDNYIQMSKDEEALFRQKSRVQWIDQGDSNTKFFFKSVKDRINKNKILSLTKEDGTIVFDSTLIKGEATSYFSNLFSRSEDQYRPGVDMRFMGDKTLSQLQATNLIKEVTREEIKQALFSMEVNKSPGPDGFSVHFYKTAWAKIGEDFIEAVLFFFQSGRLLKEINHTALSLIPKVANPSGMGDYRPIACCNVLYKCISKILANRIKAVLPDLINESQSAFIPGRTISDNVLLAQELVHNYHRKNLSPRSSIRVDFFKAYDTVEWSYLFELLKVLKFPYKFVGWIKECVCTAKFSVNINGELTGFFGSSRGLRQGDPMSAYLFVIVMESLSRIIEKRVEEDTQFEYHWRCKDTRTTHLSFADDLLLFCGNSLRSARLLNQSLKDFTIWSGLKPNMQKSFIYTAGDEQDYTNSLLNEFQFQQGILPVRYLGLPLVTKRVDAAACKPLVDSMVSRIRGWTMRFLSFAGRLQLIKTILSSLHVFWTSHFMLPKKIIKRVEQHMRDFLWKGQELRRGGAKVAWKDVSKPMKEGGLGIRNLNEWNQAAIAKLIWKIQDPTSSSIWTHWVQANMLKGRSLWEISTPADCTGTWRKILAYRQNFRENIKSIIGDGKKVFLWYDNWLPSGPIQNTIGDDLIAESGLSKKAKVAQILRQRQWRWPWSRTPGFRLIKQTLRSFHVPDGNTQDSIVWKPDNKGKFSIASAWNSIRIRGELVEWHDLVWFKGRIPKASFCLWLAVRERLYTQDRWFTQDLDMKCLLCNNNEEDHQHLFFKCEWSKQLWNLIKTKCKIQAPDLNWQSMISWLSHDWKPQNLRTLSWRLSFALTVYSIWMERNSRLHNGSPLSVQTIKEKIIDMARMKMASLKGVRESSMNKEVALEWNLSTIFTS